MSDDRRSQLEKNYDARVAENVALKKYADEMRTEIVTLEKRIADFEHLLGKRTAPVDYAVVRFSNDYPLEWRANLDGRWFSLDETSIMTASFNQDVTVARAIKRYEANDSGQVAETFLVSLRPDQA